MAEFICIACKHTGKPKRIKRGSLKLDVMGWLMFPLGVPYTLWRIFAPRRVVCMHCGEESLLSVESVAGQRLVKITAGEDVTFAALPTGAAPPPVEMPPPPPPPERPKRPLQDPNEW